MYTSTARRVTAKPATPQPAETTNNNTHPPTPPIRLPCGPDDPRLLELAKAYETILRIVENIDQESNPRTTPHQSLATENSTQGEGEGENSTGTNRAQSTLTPLTQFRSGIEKTPMRAAKAIMEMTQGYEGSVDDLINDAIFESEASSSDLIIVCDIEFTSLCEHHLLPFSGHVHIGYLPQYGQILGLSKFARITNLFSQRLQVQEMLTRSISTSIHSSKLKPKGVIVMVEAEHSCMSCRGVKKSSKTITTAIMGEISSDHRAEFLSLVNRRD